MTELVLRCGENSHTWGWGLIRGWGLIKFFTSQTGGLLEEGGIIRGWGLIRGNTVQ